MARRPSMELALAATLLMVALAMKWPLLEAPPYGDENLHYSIAKHPADPLQGYTTVWGDGIPLPTFWQRPAYYVAMMGPAELGFDAFRLSHAVLASFLAPLGALLVRRHGGAMASAVGAGIVLAVLPVFVVWGALAFADVLMTTLLMAFFLARTAGRWGWMAAFGLLAVWTKETAYAAILAVFILDVARAVRRGDANLDPLRLPGREAGLLLVVLLGPWPLAWAIAQGLLMPGGPAYGDVAHTVGLLFPTVWLFPLLLVGLALPRSRPLSAIGLAAPAAFLLLWFMGRAVEAWYGVPSQAFVIVGAASAADALVRAAGGFWSRFAAAGSGALAFTLCVLLAFAPGPGLRGLLAPGSDAPTWGEAIHFQTGVRDQDLMAALAAIPMHDHPSVLYAQNGWPFPTVTLQPASHVYFDFPDFRRRLGFGVEDLALRIENGTTWTVLGPGDAPMQRAISQVYSDCRVAAHGDWQVFHGVACAGRSQLLEAANRAHGGP